MFSRAHAGLLFALCTLFAMQAAIAQQPAGSSPSSSGSSGHPFTEAEMHERGLTLIANQHKNDEAFDLYERVEHQIERSGGPNPHTIEDRTVRFEPIGAGATKVILKDNGQDVSAADLRREVQAWASMMQYMANPDDERTKTAVAKYSKRKQERTHLVDALLTAYIPKWAGTETLNGHLCDVFALTPDPNFHPHSIFEEALPHASVKIWVEQSSIQLIRAEALITSDVSVGAGVLGKLYKGGTFVMEQGEAVPGVWMPTRYQFDFSGRKFLFSFENHQAIDIGQYRYVGSPKDALDLAERELADPKLLPGDP